ncbi:MAG: hypothetical protein ABJG88_13575 [Litorimonas sp.]
MSFWLHITRFVAFCLCVAAPLAIWAAPIDDIQALVDAGQYEQARHLATQMDTAEGYILAAESLSAQIMLGEVDKLNKHSKQARELAQMALHLDPDSYDAKLQYALADGFVTRTSGNLTAWRKNLPMKTYSSIQDLRQDYPNDARVIALEAAWHLGVVRKAGEKSGQKWFGASSLQGRELYNQAIELAPQNIIIRSNYVIGLLALKHEPDMADIKSNIEDVLLMTPNNYMETKVQQRMQEIYTNLNNKALCKKHAEDFLDGQ